MRRFIFPLATLPIMAGLSLQLRAAEFDNTPIESFDLTRYLGKWYEIARFDHSFERGLSQVSAEYVLMDNDKIKVINEGVKNGKTKTAIGKAFRPEAEDEPALIRVSFFLFFYSDYRILWIDPDYQLVLVGGSSKNYLWILSRSPKIEKAALDHIVSIASSKGYDTTKLIFN